MGFFAKTFLGVSSWSDEDLADEDFRLSQKKVDNLRDTPWGKVEQLAQHQAQSKLLDAQQEAVLAELARRGLTSEQVSRRTMLRKIGK